MNHTLRLFIAAALSFPIYAAETPSSTARDYNMSMAGALINQHCEQTWETGRDISVNACRYRVAQLYNFAIASSHFEKCTDSAGGDIVQIAECMTEKFGNWMENSLEKAESY